MQLVIVEDEITASENLSYLLSEIDPSIEVIKVLDSVKAAVDYFKTDPKVDLVLMDIHLADGLSFEIFKQVELSAPIIFTTAYDQYAIQAFKVNSVDYILKPVNKNDLSAALKKYKLRIPSEVNLSAQLNGLLASIQDKKPTFKTTYLVQKRDELVPVAVENIAYFYIDTGMVKSVTKDNQTYVVNSKLEDIETELDPSVFHRVNRQFILNRTAIVNMKFYFNGKLIINTSPKTEERVVVSKAKASEVKSWMNS
jgi:two-component system response regulator LytT